MLRRLPIESGQPVVVFAAARLALVVLALVGVVLTSFPYDGRSAAVLGLVALPWAVANLALAAPRAEQALNPLVAVGDVVVLVVLQVVEPEMFGAVRATALFFVASHAHFQGERRGLALAALASVRSWSAPRSRGDEPVSGDVLAPVESVFVVAALATALVVGTLRTAESASRMRARGLSRRTIQSESHVRRGWPRAIHDGPVQELIGLDMILSAAASSPRGRTRVGRAHRGGRRLAMRNLRALRDEIVDLGPYAFEELTFDTAIETCIPVWKRRYGFEVMATIERIPLPERCRRTCFESLRRRF